ncbi:hypothetical protein ES703_33805 [subsurface metagenome]
MIKVEKKNQQEFIVKVEEKEYDVGLDDEYWQDLTGGKIAKEELIKKSFEFFTPLRWSGYSSLWEGKGLWKACTWLGSN